MEEYRPVGFVADYITVPSSYGSPYTFSTSTTYLVNSSTYFGSTVTFQPGCIIKFNGYSLLIYGSITCNGTLTNPSILTDYGENLYGDPISANCPAQSASPALWDYYIGGNLLIKNMRFRYAQTAMRFDANGCGTYSHSVSGCIFDESQTGIVANNCAVSISSSTRSDVTTPTSSVSCGSFSGSLTDVGNVDADGNHLLDNQDYKYFGQLGTLPGNAAGQLTLRTAGHSPSTDQPIWSYRDDSGTGTYVYNTSCWLYGVSGFTAFSPYNSYQGSFRAGTLITPRHAVVADHFNIPVGTSVRFVGSDNATYTRTVVKYSVISPPAGPHDYGIIVLDSDLPPVVGYVRILPGDAYSKVTTGAPTCPGARLPAIGFNQRKEAFIFDVSSLQPSGEEMDGTVSLWFPTWGSYCRHSSSCGCANSDITSGDSGSPTFALLNNELVLIGPWWSCTPIASWQGNFLNDLNNTIMDQDIKAFGHWTGYSATVYPVTGFPTLR